MTMEARPGSNSGASATITIDCSYEIGPVDRNIFGHFLESGFFGNIEGGIFDEESHRSISEPGLLQGMRTDVMDACRQLGLPIVRWPGGNFTSLYHWEDGIGPRDTRPSRLNLAWGGEESNRVGTDEFLAWCADLSAEPYLAHSCRNVDEAIRWVEYTNYSGDTAYTRQRARNARWNPWGVRYWGVGNEVYGPWQMGYRPPEQYAADAREHAQFMRLVDPSIKIIAVGHHEESWTRPLLAKAGHLIDYVSYHLYGASTHLLSSTDESAEFDNIVAQSIHIEEQIRKYSEMVGMIARQAGIERPLALAIDEWNMRHLEPASWPEPQPGADGGIAPRETPAVDDDAPEKLRVSRYSPRTLADALFYAGVLHGFQRMAGLDVPPTMANTVNLINANGLLAVRPDGVVRSATYHVWDLLQNHTGSLAVCAETVCTSTIQEIRRGPRPVGKDGFPRRPGAVPILDVSATLAEDRRTLFLSVINRHKSEVVVADLVRDAASTLPPHARIRQLGADTKSLFAVNTLSQPDELGVRDLGEVDLHEGRCAFPAHSLTVCEFDVS